VKTSCTGTRESHPRSVGKPSLGTATIGRLALGVIAASILYAAPADAQEVQQTVPAVGQDIHQAIRNGDAEQVRAILERDAATIHVRQGGILPLHQAVRQGNLMIAELLLAKGADVNRFGADATEFSPHEATPVTEAIRVGRMDMVRMFVEQGADLSRVTSYGETYLHFAVFANRKEAVDLLIDHGIDVNVKKRGGLTPLHLAAVMGYDGIVEMLIQKGARLDPLSTDGGTPLHFAEAAGRATTAALLRSKGARDVPREFPHYAGAYLGIETPGSRPVPFAPELFRDIYRVHSTPAFSPDGRELYWECMFMPGNNDAHRIWFMKEENGRWTPPRVAPFSTYPSGGPAFFADGRRLVYFSSQPRDGGDRPAADVDLWVVEREGDGWRSPKHLDTPLNRDGSQEVYPYVATDGSIYVNRGREGFVKSAWIEGKYGDVEIIGDLFDTDAIDTCRAMEHILLFSSRGRPGQFEYEIYISFHGQDGRWLQPVYLGDRLHPGRRATQAVVTLDGKYLFFNSNFSFEWVAAGILEQLRPRPDAGIDR